MLDLQSYFWLKRLRSDKPSHKHDSNKYQTKAFATCDHKWDQTRSATHVNKTYLVWLMFRVLSNQHYQHRTNQNLRSWANPVFQNRGICATVSLSPLPLPRHSFFFCSRPNALDELERKRLLRRLQIALNGWLITALFTNMRTLKFKSRLHNWVFRCRQSWLRSQAASLETQKHTKRIEIHQSQIPNNDLLNLLK